MSIKYLAKLPCIPGADLLHPDRKSAEREIANAAKAGYDVSEAIVVEVMLRVAA